MVRTLGNFRSASAQADDPSDTATPARASSRSRKRAAPATPPQNVGIDIAMIRWPGLHVITRSTAPWRSGPMASTICSNSVSLVSGRSGMWMRPIWLVTPRGRMASVSGCTIVLVEGMTMPSLRR